MILLFHPISTLKIPTNLSTQTTQKTIKNNQENLSFLVQSSVMDRRANKPRRKTPSFSSSLPDAICDSIDERQEVKDFVHSRGDGAKHVEEEIESLRRAINVEKWMGNYSAPRHFPSNSGSSTDSSMFSCSETESSVSRSTPSSSVFAKYRPKYAQTPPNETVQKCEGRFTRTKLRALKIYGDLKRAKEPISPGGKIANFLNSLFSPRNSKKHPLTEEWSSMRKLRSVKDTTTRSSSVSRSCLTQKSSSSCNKPKRSVKFSPVSVILDKDCGHRSIYNADYSSVPNISSQFTNIGSQFTRRNVDTFRLYEEKNMRKHELRARELYENESDEDDKSCASSELFELENIGRVGIGAYDEELPVYETTSVKMNQAIARGFVM